MHDMNVLDRVYDAYYTDKFISYDIVEFYSTILEYKRKNLTNDEICEMYDYLDSIVI